MELVLKKKKKKKKEKGKQGCLFETIDSEYIYIYSVSINGRKIFSKWAIDGFGN